MTITWRDLTVTRLMADYMNKRPRTDTACDSVRTLLIDQPGIAGELLFEVRLLLDTAYRLGANDGARYNGVMDRDRLAQTLDNLVDIWAADLHVPPRLELVR